MQNEENGSMETNTFGTEALKCWAADLRGIPIQPGTKEPARGLTGWPGYVSSVPSKEKQQQWLDQYRGYGFGLLTGSPLDDEHVLVGIDVDDDRMVRCAFAVFPDAKCAKIGKKGVTIFARAPKADRITSTAFHNEQANSHADILAGGKYTVMPSSIHPDTGRPYRWHGEKITETNLSKLPLFDRAKFNLLKTIYGSKNLAPLLDGKTTHDAGVSLVAQIVRFVTDEEIEAILRAILPEDYDGNSLKELPGWIATAREKNFDKISEVPIDDAVALVIQESMKPLVYSVGDNFLRYMEGHWKPVSDVEIDRLAKQLLAPQIGPKRQVGPMLPSVRKCLSLNVEKPNFGQYSTKICVKNGTLDIPSGRLEEHSPDHQLRYQLDIEYDHAATCPVYEDQISQTLKGDAQSIALYDEFAALTLVPDMRFQKALYLVGPGGSGKSTLLKTVEMMHDPNAISVTPLDKIDSERYLTNLARKLVCISFDIQTTKKVYGESFIRITGGDPVTTRELYKEVEGLVTPTVRFLGSMNPDMPGFIAAPDALERRLILLPCSGRVQKPDPDRFSALKSERAGILSRWVVALRRLYDRGGFDIPETAMLEVEEYVHQQDAFDLFAAERLVQDKSAKLTVAEITRQFNEWAKNMAASELAAHVIGRKLRRLGFEGGYERINHGDGTTTNVRVVYARMVNSLAVRKGF